MSRFKMSLGSGQDFKDKIDKIRFILSRQVSQQYNISSDELFNRLINNNCI